MERAMFGVMVPVREKQAMDFVSRETGMPLSRIFYPTVHRAVEAALGRVLIDRVDNGRPADGMPILPVEPGAGTPQIFRDFGHLIEGHTDKFSAIFPMFNFSFNLTFIEDVSVEDISRHIGREYLENGEPFDRIDAGEARLRLFRLLLHEFYRTSAIGPIVDLEEAWRTRKAEIDTLAAILVKEYLDLYEEIVEVVLEPGEGAVEAEIVEEAAPAKGKKGRRN